MAQNNEADIATLVRNARVARNLSQPQLARLVGTSQQTIDKIESRKVQHSSFMPAIAQELGIPLAKVLRLGHTNGTVATIPGHNLVMGDRDLPVYAATHNGVGGVQALSSEPVDSVIRPEPLARVRDGYGFIVIDDNMSPEFEVGDIALVNPHVPARAGKTCVFRKTAEDGVVLFRLYRLQKVTDRDWIVSEWSDKGTHSLRRSEWPVAHVTVGNFKG